MENAKEELLEILKDKPPIKCAEIKYGHEWADEPQEKILLPVNYTAEMLSEFFKRLDFEYDSGFGSQLLFGTIWLGDDTWLERGEYDGSEWWEYQKCPAIPSNLIN